MIQATPPAASTSDGTSAIPGVAEIAQQRLRECPYPALRQVNCCFDGGVLVLTGGVPTFYMKQMAQTLLCRLEHVEVLDNRLVVSSGRGMDSILKERTDASAQPQGNAVHRDR